MYCTYGPHRGSQGMSPSLDRVVLNLPVANDPFRLAIENRPRNTGDRLSKRSFFVEAGNLDDRVHHFTGFGTELGLTLLYCG